jgi:thioredoxin
MRIDEFTKLIHSAEKPLVIDFWAPWCTPCRMMDPILKKTEQKYQGKIKVLKINSDESPELIRKLDVMSIPTLMGYQNGTAVFRKIGVQRPAEVDRLFASLVGEQQERRGLSGMDRVLRVGLGFALIVAGIITGLHYWLIGLGGLALFSAVYDRCPIYRMVAPRVGKFIKRIISRTEETLN